MGWCRWYDDVARPNVTYEKEVERASDGSAQKALTRIRYSSSLEDAVRDADLVIESAPERLANSAGQPAKASTSTTPWPRSLERTDEKEHTQGVRLTGRPACCVARVSLVVAGEELQEEQEDVEDVEEDRRGQQGCGGEVGGLTESLEVERG